MKQVISMCAVLALVLGSAFQAQAADKILFSYEENAQGWEIPEWALEKEDYVAKVVEPSKDVAKDGVSSLKIVAEYPGKLWTAAMVENAEYFDWTPYKAISADLYLPAEAPTGLKAKIVLTVGESWTFIEMARSVALVPGQWTTITAGIVSGSEDWKKAVVDDNFRKDVRKIAIRIESNKNPVYSGPIYIDNVRLTANDAGQAPAA